MLNDVAALAKDAAAVTAAKIKKGLSKSKTHGLTRSP